MINTLFRVVLILIGKAGLTAPPIPNKFTGLRTWEARKTRERGVVSLGSSQLTQPIPKPGK